MLEVQKVQVFSRVIEDIQDRGFMYLIPEQNVLLLCPHQNPRLVRNEKTAARDPTLEFSGWRSSTPPGGHKLWGSRRRSFDSLPLIEFVILKMWWERLTLLSEMMPVQKPQFGHIAILHPGSSSRDLSWIRGRFGSQ